MKTSIFIKTWLGDVPWLRYCLESIKLYASGFEEVVVVGDMSCKDQVDKLITTETVYYAKDWDNGYVQQQWIKLIADKYISDNSDKILFVDSDCVFHTPFTPESFLKDGKPILMKTRYGNLGGAEAWRPITSSYVGFDVDYEYMRRLPWMYLASSLSKFRMAFPHTELFLQTLETRDFSEFNALGAFIDRYTPEDYYITDTEVWVPDGVAEQFWSWGGFTSEILERINKYLKVGA